MLRSTAFTKAARFTKPNCFVKTTASFTLARSGILSINLIWQTETRNIFNMNGFIFDIGVLENFEIKWSICMRLRSVSFTKSVTKARARGSISASERFFRKAIFAYAPVSSTSVNVCIATALSVFMDFNKSLSFAITIRVVTIIANKMLKSHCKFRSGYKFYLSTSLHVVQEQVMLVELGLDSDLQDLGFVGQGLQYNQMLAKL